MIADGDGVNLGIAESVRVTRRKHDRRMNRQHLSHAIYTGATIYRVTNLLKI